MGEAASGKPFGPQLDRTTLADMLEMLQADYRAKARRSHDRAQQAGAHLRSFFCPDRKAREITSDLITSYATCQLSEKAKPSTVNYEMAMLRRAFRLAARAGKVAGRPEFDMLEVHSTRKGSFEPEQYRAVVAHLPDYLKPVAQAAYITGWRVQSELLTRAWRHLDLDAGWLRLEPGEGKTAEARNFPLTPELRRLLESQRERVRVIERETGRIIPWIFAWSDGRHIADFRASWKNVCIAADLPGRLVHDFRRTAVRNLERAGVPRSAAMKLTGHETGAVYRRYAIVDSAMLQEAAVKLAALHAAEANSPSTAQVADLEAVR